MLNMANNSYVNLISGVLNKIKHSERLYKIANWIFQKLGIAGNFSLEFKQLFFKKEIDELYGDKNGNFWKIVLLYLTLFVSVGFGIQSKNFFNKQLDNPFVRFISIPIREEAATCTELIDSLNMRYTQPAYSSKFNLDTIRSLSVGNPLRFSSENVEITFEGMADDFNSDLVVEAVCNKDNGYIGKQFSTIEDRSVIVTLNFLKDLYLVDDDKTIEELTPEDIPGYIMFQPSGYGQSIPLLVQGVAEQLPYGYNFLLPNKFNSYLFYDSHLLFYDESDTQISFYIDTLIETSQLKSAIQTLADQNSIDAGDANLIIEKTASIHGATIVSFPYISANEPFKTVVKEELKSKFGLNDSQIIDAFLKQYDINGPNYPYKAPKTAVLVVFDDLKKVRSFSEDIKAYSSEIITNSLMVGSTKKLKGIELEMTSVKLRFILNIIEVIVTAFLIIIGILAVTSLMSFVRVLFEKYFQRIEKNIGTFMAFGINIKIVYSIMLSVFVFTTVIISFILAIIVGWLAELLMVALIGNSVGENLNLFSVFNLWSLGALAAIIFANVYAFKNASRIFSKWPGDIINSRDIYIEKEKKLSIINSRKDFT
jgi:hypothetical protein